MNDDQPNFNGTALDTSIPQELLNIDNKRRSNLFPWNGQFSPQLIEVLLQTHAPKDAVILDPFAGSGTVLFEAARLGIPVVGAELNPAACAMARVYSLMNLTVAERRSLVNRLETALQDSLPEKEPSLFATSEQTPHREAKECLLDIHRNLDDEYLKNILEALIVLVDFYQEVTGDRIYETWAKLKGRILNLPAVDSLVRLVNCDARSLPLQDAEIDLVITSPPYINVFNYHQQYRRSAEALGWNLLTIARSEIGSNRKHRGNRFLTVIQYCLDMAEVLAELQRVCKDRSRIIIIVGRESNVRKTRFFNGEIIADLASRCTGLGLQSRQERVFMNRYGAQIYEDILHFQVTKSADVPLVEAKSVAREVLTRAKKRTPPESLDDLADALQRVEEVRPSPVGDPENRQVSTRGTRWLLAPSSCRCV